MSVNNSRQWTEEDYEFVKKEGEKRGYPAVNVLRNGDGFTFAKLLPGKEAWEAQMSNRLGDNPYRDRFVDFVEAVKREDYVKEDEKSGE